MVTLTVLRRHGGALQICRFSKPMAVPFCARMLGCLTDGQPGGCGQVLVGVRRKRGPTTEEHRSCCVQVRLYCDRLGCKRQTSSGMDREIGDVWGSPLGRLVPANEAALL